jgi:hypothetical protein
MFNKTGIRQILVNYLSTVIRVRSNLLAVANQKLVGGIGTLTERFITNIE